MEESRQSLLRRWWWAISLGALAIVLVGAKLSVRSAATGESILPGVQGAPVLGLAPTATPPPGPPRARVRVQVTDPSGQPVPQAFVEVRDRFNAVAGTQGTGQSGEVVLSLPATTGYTVSARKEGYAPAISNTLDVAPPPLVPTASAGSTPVRLPPQFVRVQLEPLAQQAASVVRLFAGHTSSPRISAIDPASSVLLKHSDTLGQGRLTFVAASPDAKTIYVSWSGHPEVLILEGSELNVSRNVPLEGGNVTALTVNPINGHLWVAISTPETTDSGALHEIDPVSGQVLRRIHIGPVTSGLHFRPDGTRLYARHRSTNALSVIDPASGAILNVAKLPQWPADMALSADGKHLLLVFLGSERLLEVDAMTGDPGRSIELGAGAAAIAAHPDGRRAFVVNQILGSVQIVDLQTAQVTDLIPVGRTPRAIAASPSSQLLYVANAGSGTISVVDPDKRAVKETLNVGGSPSALFLVEPTA